MKNRLLACSGLVGKIICAYFPWYASWCILWKVL